MTFLKSNHKNFKRLRTIFLNILRIVLTSILSLLLPYIIVNYFSKTLWGKFVEIQLYFFLALIVSDWGAKNYLQKAFSKTPRVMIKTWQKQFLVRIPIFLITLLVLILCIQSQNLFVLTFWFLSAFVYHSFFPIIFYNRDYLFFICIEAGSFIFLNIFFFTTKEHLTIDKLILYYSIYMLIKAIFASIKYFSFLKFKQTRIRLSLLKYGFPFLLIAITGFLHSKIDVYVYAFFSNNNALGEYQIISSFFIFSQSLVTILIFPYIKNVYRINVNSLKKIHLQVAVFGFFINIIIIITTALILKNYFKIQLTLLEYFIGFFIGYPTYVYSIKVFELFKFNKENKVVFISFMGLLLNLVLSIIFLFLNYDITGVLLATAITQVVTMLIYFIPLSNDKLS